MAGPKQTLYAILGVPADANGIDVGLAYRRRMAELQRAVPQDPSALALLHEAHEVLADPQRRAAYDASLVTRAEVAEAARQAHAPDLVLEPEVDTAAKRMGRRPGLALVILGVAIAFAGMFFALRSPRVEGPPVRAAEAPAPKPAAPEPPPPKVRTPAEILGDAVASSGRVLGYDMAGRIQPIGIATAAETGTMATTCHGIPAGHKLVVRIGDTSHPAELAITDEALNLCKLSLSEHRVKPLPRASEEPKTGDRIYALGVNGTGEFAMTEGTIRQVRTVAQGRVYELSMPVAPLGSGGGVFDEFGRLIGIATTRSSLGAGLSIAVPVSWLAEARSRAS